MLNEVQAMKIDRLLGIITTLINSDRVKAKDLAEKFEVSVRTIHRDIEAICMAGIPLVTYPGGDGGISIAEGYKLDKNLLTSEELSDIIIGLKSIDSISLGNNIKTLLEKLTPKNEDIMTVSDNIFIDLTSFYRTSLSAKINLIKKSVNNNLCLSFNYFSSNGITGRSIEPYFITFKWSAWYVFGYCYLREDFRLFKLNRMDMLIVTTKAFIPRNIPEDKTQLDNYFDGGNEKITLLLDRSVEYLLVDSYGTNSYKITEDNMLLFELEYTSYDYALRTILSFGDKATIISPDSVISDIRGISENICKKYK